jgi:hypothetical protein
MHGSRLLQISLLLPILMASSYEWRPTAAQTNPANCNAISERDATILLYLIPDAFDLRMKGDDVGIERTPLAERRTPGKYAFQLRGLKPNPNGSTLLGNFTVDRCSGLVIEDDLNEVVRSPTLQGVQRIMTRTKEQ